MYINAQGKILMKKHISIEVDLETLENRQNVTGDIYFVIDHHRYFPEEGWSDFVVTILTWWINSIKGLIVSDFGKPFEFDFMDGTPIVLAKKLDNEDLELSFCIDEGVKHQVILTANCSIKEVRDSILSVSKKVIRLFESEKWNREDIDELKDLVLSLERYPFSYCEWV
ncbi:hypothetical protein J7I93_22190 [Bacillus sp. ISL-47]|uniref:hypothetical protein n=1 Tax=Bacillus sp. ISL-47 TaxID=2819130 RepID=UPI001BE73A55|nr:hypothetical protein [Bacillus sp. ISL-47]MBT2690852.1 hypothetical protein [Bacillus sp. ISL-47]MBT2710987.1 hypothetical protein [Pseudomonas sp. ISL-84]